MASEADLYRAAILIGGTTRVPIETKADLAFAVDIHRSMA